MSWITESLLNNREQIKSEADINSDEFNDLIAVEKAIFTLKSQGRLSYEDLIILGIMPDPITRKRTKNEKQTIYKKRAALCERVAYYLGGYFTDEGYLDYMSKKHNLDEEQVNKLRAYIKSEYKHKIMRKPLNNE